MFGARSSGRVTAISACGSPTPSASFSAGCRRSCSRYSSDPDDPALRRLQPSAYEDDAEAEEEYGRLMHGELESGRRDALRLLAETADQDRLTVDELDAWLRALTDLRLALGTRLDVTEEVYTQQIDPGDAQAYELSVFAYLSWLQEQAVEAAMRG